MTVERQEQYTVDELSVAVGVPARTIRFYQSQGALPAPRRAGRLAYYDADHVERLRLIALLRERGLRLDAIAEVLDQLGAGGDSLQAWLGLSAWQSAGPWSDERAALLDADEMSARTQGDDRLIDEFIGVGLVRRDQGPTGTTVYRVPSPTLLDSALALAKVGVPTEVSVGSAEMVRHHVTEMAERLVEQYARHFRDDPRYATDAARQQRALEVLRLVAFGVVRTLFAREIERRLHQLIVDGPLALVTAGEVPSPRPDDDIGTGTAPR